MKCLRYLLCASGLCLLVAAFTSVAADATKTLRVAFVIAETGFDPAAASDLYSHYVNREMFDPLYRYELLTRPYKVIPNTAAGMPEISSDGKTWTIRVKPGIYFADDPAFKGVKRELTAADYVYSWKRILDPRTRSNFLGIFDQHFIGADEVMGQAKETGKFDYDAPIEGLQAIDRYTIRMKLKYSDYELLQNLTQTPTSAVAREVVEAYGDASGMVMANPVGTGPFRLKEWRRGQKIVLEKNPGFRDERYPDSSDPADKPIVSKLRGRKIPIVDFVEITIIEESNPRWLAFEQGQLDYVTIPSDFVSNVLDADNKLKPQYAKAGMSLGRGLQPTITYTYFNMEDPVVGGYTPDKIALRRAIGMAYNTDEEIRVLRQGQAIPATQVIPPSVTAYNPKFDGRAKFNPAAAMALLDKFGYVDKNGDGWRDMPDGKPLVLKYATSPSALERQYNELWQRSMNAVGLKIEFVTQKWPDLLKMGRFGQLQMWGLANTSTTTDPFDFFDLLYGPHAGFSNLGRFKLPEFDKLHDQARSMPDSPERTKILQKMSELVAVYAPWTLHAYRYENIVTQPWLIGYKYNAFYQQPWRYYDIDLARRQAALK